MTTTINIHGLVGTGRVLIQGIIENALKEHGFLNTNLIFEEPITYDLKQMVADLKDNNLLNQLPFV